MPVSWPSAFPELPTYIGTTEGPPDVVIRTPMDVGPPKIRRRMTTGSRMCDIRLLMTATVLNAASPNGFDAFYVTDCLCGTSTFTWKNPRTEASVTMRFASVPQYRSLGGANYEVTFTAEILP